jgi:hypothetical protein
MIYWSAAGVTYTNDIIRNNIFYNVPYSVYLYVTGKIGPNMITMDYNCYWSTGSLSGSYIWREFSGTPSYNLNQLSQFQSATGQDVHSFVADPKFTNAANGDFHITAGSPCINKGTIATSATDLDGNQRSSPYDIGAYEYGAIVPVLPRESIPGAVNMNAYFTGAKSIFRIAGDRFIMPQGFAGQTGACAVYDLSGNLLKTIYVGNGIIDFSKGQRMSDGVYVVQMKERSYHASKSKED